MYAGLLPAEKTAELWQTAGSTPVTRYRRRRFYFHHRPGQGYFKTIQGKFVAPPPIEGLFAKNKHAEPAGRGSQTVMVTVLSEAATSLDR